ncbi:MAG TPA: DUF1572 family protein [Bacteroidia bacterium]|nr:DUF1572 family protein [Bacteroidia bacterium]
MDPQNLARLFARDISKLRDEINAYASDAALWQPSAGITNTGGTLSLHLCGNLRHFIGHVLGGTGYVRDRDKEFSTRDVTKKELTAIVDQTAAEVQSALSGFSENRMQEQFPKDIGGTVSTTEYALLHLFGHFSYHLGQINYHRRMTSK